MGFRGSLHGSNPATPLKFNVRFTPKSKHRLSPLGCLLCAKSGHPAASLDYVLGVVSMSAKRQKQTSRLARLHRCKELHPWARSV